VSGGANAGAGAGPVASGRGRRYRGGRKGGAGRALYGDGSLPLPRPSGVGVVNFRYPLAMRIDFTKMHGAGNDFIVFDAPADGSSPAAEQFRPLGDRRTGIGFDQALVLEPARQPSTAAFYRIFNSDGSEVEQC